MSSNNDIEKVLLAAQSRVAYRDIEDMTLDDAKLYAASAGRRHVELRQRRVEMEVALLEEELADTSMDAEEIVQELENEGEGR